MTTDQPAVATQEISGAPSLVRSLARGALTARGRSGDLAPRRLVRRGVQVDRDHLARYQRLVEAPVGDVLPHAYPHLLGFPLAAKIMSDKDFPLPMPGLVHVENATTVHRTLTADDTVDVTVWAEALRPHPKGRTVDLVTLLEADGETVWRETSTYLQRGRGDATADRGREAPGIREGVGCARWPLAADLGRRYAAVSGDVNPIHLHPWTARAMGFPRAIAHGMWTGARTLAALGPQSTGPSRSHVWFRKPVLLPTTVELVVDRSVSPQLAVLRSASRPETVHLVATLDA
ncbi:MaoC family dehydratase [Arsenicicoccus sp. oral taxon 190]|uniref:MaoC family dehydratase n=1 Tax=Arsenicicoccus sp. oral taxon 190 TaxID=1658671 RepID=UPI000679ED99|nr:MaoC/PaaZ C-terminal domain-containing protein [Arsenicicoccus sp. oral taxon 190]AKT50421.1 dehydratase [Arsenicicoccus sp. oral taxon 190]